MQLLTRTECREHRVSQVSEFIELLHSKAVLIHRFAGDTVQLGGVRQPDTDGVDVDACCSGLFRFRNGSAGVDVGHTVSYHDGHIGNPWTVAIGCCEHLSPHGVESVGRVGAAVTVRNIVEGLKQRYLVLVSVEIKLHVILGAVNDDSHSRVARVYVSDEKEVLDKVLHHQEVVFRDTGRCIQHKHQVHFSVDTGYKKKTNGLC